ncbi:hypothetical protein Cylst_0665 [Cylindrospermum stagnale PCC 7417]|uniref:Uncharacterized protein n=1 Tax=Cylindrospermum stagnale PCC 7417 TaxID=56107 RepID=K9WT67_9NOST|nr:hypothetical protein Cylst_0665 [Cylindrospermum stagnale PCC 7417]
MRILLCFVIALLVALSGYSSNAVLSQETPSNSVGGVNVSISSMSVVADLPWSTPDIQPRIFTFQTSNKFEPEFSTQIPPDLIQGVNGKLWLVLTKGKVATQEGNSWRLLNTDAARVDKLITIAPLTNGSVILLGLDSNEKENILAAVDSSGALLWRRTGTYDSNKLDLSLLRGYFNDLIVDTDGAVYLPGTRIRGAFARIDPVSGATPQVLDIGEYHINDDGIFIYKGELFRVLYDNGVFYWIRRPIVGGSDNKMRTSEKIQDLVAYPLGVLPDGGALLSKDPGSLTWMSPTGEATRQNRLLAGIVRHGKEVFAAIPGDDQMTVVHSTGDHTEREFIGKLPEHARLIRADDSGYDFLLGYDIFDDASNPPYLGQISRPVDRLIHVDRKTKEHRVTKLSTDVDRRLSIEGKVSYDRPVIVDSNTLLLVGTDPKGAFVVRISFSDK